MTHGCLTIRLYDQKRVVLLHTSHTGMDIPLAVDMAIDVLANRDYDIVKAICDDNKKSIKKYIDSGKLMDYLIRISYSIGSASYPPKAAALVIAAVPDFLHPIPNAFIKNLPTWSGLDRPFKLIIGKKDHDYLWRLFNAEGEKIKEVDVLQEVNKRLVEKLLN